MENGCGHLLRMSKKPLGPRKARAVLRPAAPPLFLGLWLRALNVKASDLAREANINEGYLSELISGRKKRPSDEIKEAIAQYLKIPVESLRRPPPTREVIEAARQLGPSILTRLHDLENDPSKPKH